MSQNKADIQHSAAIKGAAYHEKGFLHGRYTGQYDIEGTGDGQQVWYTVQGFDGNEYEVKDVPEHQEATIFHIELRISETVIAATAHEADVKSYGNVSFGDILEGEIEEFGKKMSGRATLAFSEEIRGTIKHAEHPDQAEIDWEANTPKIGTREDAPLMVAISEVLPHMPQILRNVDTMALWLDIEEFLCDRVSEAPKVNDERIYFVDLPNEGTVVGVIESARDAIFDTDKQTVISWVETFYKLLGEYTGSVILINE